MLYGIADSNVIGLVSSPNITNEVIRAQNWERDFIAQGNRLAVPDMMVYEVVRELKLQGKTIGIARLEESINRSLYIPTTREILDIASDLWAELRKRGKPTVSKEALNFDTILAAHAIFLNNTGSRAVVAATNLRHLSLMTETYDWRDPLWKTLV